jgi:hypothetical protein
MILIPLCRDGSLQEYRIHHKIGQCHVKRKEFSQELPAILPVVYHTRIIFSGVPIVLRVPHTVIILAQIPYCIQGESVPSATHYCRFSSSVRTTQGSRSIHRTAPCLILPDAPHIGVIFFLAPHTGAIVPLVPHSGDIFPLVIRWSHSLPLMAHNGLILSLALHTGGVFPKYHNTVAILFLGRGNVSFFPLYHPQYHSSSSTTDRGSSSPWTTQWDHSSPVPHTVYIRSLYHNLV